MSELSDEQVFGAPQKEMSDDQVFGDRMPDPLQTSVPEAFLDRVRAGQALARITMGALKGAKEGAGEGTPTGFDDENLSHLIDMGIFHDPERGRPGPIQMANETILMPAAQLWQTITRATAGGIHGAGGAMEELVTEFGGSQGTANRAKNEVINFGNWAMIEGGMGRFSRPAATPNGVMDQTVGGLPRPEDFSNAGKVLESPHAEANLKQMWREDGIHPAEAVHDAQNDAFLKHEITAPRANSPKFTQGDLLEAQQIYREASWRTQQPESNPSHERFAEQAKRRLGEITADLMPDQSAVAPGARARINEFGDASKDTFELPIKDDAGKEVGRIEYITGPDDNAITIRAAGIHESSARGAGLGTRAYKELVDWALGEGKDVYSSGSTNDLSNAVYERLRKQGYNVTSEDGTFKISPTEPPAVKVGGYPIPREDFDALVETGGNPGSLSAAMTPPEDMPPLVSPRVQPASPPGSLVARAQAASEKLFDVGHDIQMKLAPMARGSVDSMATVKDYMNAMRRNSWDAARTDTYLTKRFSTDDLARMANAMEEESLSRRLGEPESAREHQGLATLTPEQREAIVGADGLDTRQQIAWLRARDLGMVDGDGIEMHYPRMVVGIPKGLDATTEGNLSLTAIGYDLRSRTPYMKQRKHLELEQTEKAIKDKIGMALAKQGKSADEIAAALENVKVVRDIRAVNIATKQLEDAVAGRTLVKSIQEIGKRTGTETVAEGFQPDNTWITVDHPSFKTWRPKFEEVDGKIETVKDAAGNPVFEQVPIYVRGDFEGPLRAAMWGKSGVAYGGLMALKGKTMGLIMNSPAIHNLVEFGRAFPAMPTRIVKAYFDGYRAKNDPGIMHEAIDSGLVPIGKRFFNQDINAVMEAPDLAPGRSWTAKVLAAVPGLFDEAAGTAVKTAIDKAGDFWHNTLLWDRIADLQAGLYVNFRGDLMAKGMDQRTASRVAAHWANRYAGALPREAMSEAATKFANFAMFSRSFTIGNLGVMKDMLTGLPKDVLAQIERDAGFTAGSIAGAGEEGALQQAVTSAKSIARRKAVSLVLMDVGLMYVGNSVLQSAFNVMLGDHSLTQEGHDYLRRMRDLINEGSVHPLQMLNPFHVAESLSATNENEPSRKDRVLIGYAKDGTAIYARNPVGKIGEEFSNWFGSPLDMLKKKEGTIARPLMQILSNDAGFGRKIYDPDADTATARLGNVWAILKHLGGSQLPVGQMSAAHDLITGEGDKKINLMQTFGPIAGFTFSKGAPGGPAVGEMYAAKSQHEFAVNQALPDIRRQIKRGDMEGAISRMTELDIPQGLQRWYMKTTLNPALRMSPRAVKDFYLHASEEQKARFERAKERTQPPAQP